LKFRTEIPISVESEKPIDYNANLVLLGSCFSDHIGAHFEYFKFQTCLNPFGIQFHPSGIKNLIQKAVQNDQYSENELIPYNNRWHCFDAHSSLSHSNKEVLVKKLNDRLQHTQKEIRHASHIIITLGTAWVYRFIESKKFVSNCHKIPQKKFSKELLSIDQIKKMLDEILVLINIQNPKACIIFTVSPVRHLKDGFTENNLSKAHLLSGIHSVIASQKNCFYFPSYEIMMDELRDYRFYKEDMIHPNKTAVEYIWKKFKNTWISEDAYKTMSKVELIQKGLHHKPFNKNSEAHTKFLEKLKSEQEALKKEFSHIIF